MKPSKDDGSWIRDEMMSADFGDIRLNKRFSTLAHELAARPSQSINEASTDWAAAKAAYRFFDNPKVSPELILEPHFLSTELRCESHETIVAVQDTSILDFSRHIKTSGLGLSGVSDDGYEFSGLHFHATLALTEKGLPLGLLDCQIWSRKRQKARGHELSKTPIEKKESFRWIKSLRETAKRTRRSKVIIVADREADIYDLFEEAMDQGVDLVIRLSHDRVVLDEAEECFRISEMLAVTNAIGQTEVEIPQNGSRLSRRAKMAIKFAPVTLSAFGRGPKTKQAQRRHDLELGVVDLWEVNPPKNETPLHWRLLTTLKADSQDAALRVVDIYRKRWMVESYFKTLKTGCNVEKCRLESADKLTSYIALLSVVAWRILWMTHFNRHEPNTSAEKMLTEAEWKTLWLQKHRRQIKEGKIRAILPKKAPSIYEAVRWIAMQGGFLGRKGDKEPGLITIWRGWLRLQTAVELYEVMQPSAKY